ncbi:hypothetical protein [Streptomyces sp. NPDC005345]|uniref:hypothetical protein n=1 Tax=Streptomyces sp. NPDC005345 TaxID=3156877 RepID=UPI0033B7603D
MTKIKVAAITPHHPPRVRDPRTATQERTAARPEDARTAMSQPGRPHARNTEKVNLQRGSRRPCVRGLGHAVSDGIAHTGERRAMASRGWIVTAVGGRAPDFVPTWVQLLIAVVPMAILAVVVYRRNKS